MGDRILHHRLHAATKSASPGEILFRWRRTLTDDATFNQFKDRWYRLIEITPEADCALDDASPDKEEKALLR